MEVYQLVYPLEVATLVARNFNVQFLESLNDQCTCEGC